MKVIIAGGRFFNDYDLLFRYCEKILSNQKEIEIVSGCAKGADKLGERYAKQKGYPIKEFPADWYNLNDPCIIKINKFGKKYNALAGHNRNKEMAEYADSLIAFWDGESKGTKDMIDLAKKYKLNSRIYNYKK